MRRDLVWTWMGSACEPVRNIQMDTHEAHVVMAAFIRRVRGSFLALLMVSWAHMKKTTASALAAKDQHGDEFPPFGVAQSVPENEEGADQNGQESETGDPERPATAGNSVSRASSPPAVGAIAEDVGDSGRIPE